MNYTDHDLKWLWSVLCYGVYMKVKEKCLIAVFILSFFFFGMFYEYCGTVISCVLSAMLIVCAFKRKSISVDLNLGVLMGAVLLFGYSISSFYAVDSGMAFLGIFKYLWILLFLIANTQSDGHDGNIYINMVPYIGGSMCIIGFAGYFIPYLKEHLYSNNRFCGFFQYANTAALFLLVGIIIICDKQVMKKRDYLLFIILSAGIGMTGSRTVMVLMVLVFGLLIIKNKNRTLLIVCIIFALTTIMIIWATNDSSAVSRITKISFTESTFIGRLLYAKDALPLLLKHPLGLGFKGYYYMENMIQTGLYYVVYLHNDLLQIGLDIGWIPMFIYLYAIIKTLLDKSVGFTKKMIVAVVFIHGLFDFDLAYTSILLILLLIMTDVKLLDKSFKVSVKAAFIPMIVVMLSCAYMSIPLIAFYNDDVETAVRMYPYYTEAKLTELSKTYSVDKAKKLADEIISQNNTCSLAWYAKATAAYMEDDYDHVIEYQREAISKEPFNREYYDSYEYMLSDGVEYYKNMIEDDSENLSEYENKLATVKTELDEIPHYKEKAKNRLSKWGRMIDDQPELD